jgi:hypothetical protein
VERTDATWRPLPRLSCASRRGRHTGDTPAVSAAAYAAKPCKAVWMRHPHCAARGLKIRVSAVQLRPWARTSVAVARGSPTAPAPPAPAARRQAVPDPSWALSASERNVLMGPAYHHASGAVLACRRPRRGERRDEAPDLRCNLGRRVLAPVPTLPATVAARWGSASTSSVDPATLTLGRRGLSDSAGAVELRGRLFESARSSDRDVTLLCPLVGSRGTPVVNVPSAAKRPKPLANSIGALHRSLLQTPSVPRRSSSSGWLNLRSIRWDGSVFGHVMCSSPDLMA